MTYVIVEPCIGTKNASCVDVCPVSCIYEAEDMFYINPDECIECGACEPECPVNAIFHESAVPDEWKSFTQNNRELSGLYPPDTAGRIQTSAPAAMGVSSPCRWPIRTLSPSTNTFT